jgi:hypothetical protein
MIKPEKTRKRRLKISLKNNELVYFYTNFQVTHIIFVYAVVLINEEITLFKAMDLAEGISGVVI